MAVENFTTWTEDDAGSGLSQTSPRSTFSPLDFDLDARLYKDGGSTDFYDNFEHRVEVYIDSHSGYSCSRGGLVWYSDVLGYLGDGNVFGCGLGISWGDDTKNIGCLERDSGFDWNEDVFGAAEDVLYYTKIEYTDDSLTITFYSDSGYSSVVDTTTLTLNEDYGGFRYIYCPVTNDDTDADNCTGYCQNFDLSPAAPPAGVVRNFVVLIG